MCEHVSRVRAATVYSMRIVTPAVCMICPRASASRGPLRPDCGSANLVAQRAKGVAALVPPSWDSPRAPFLRGFAGKWPPPYPHQQTAIEFRTVGVSHPNTGSEIRRRGLQL
eukprot:3146525-Prymnesium_polylepis.2